MEIKSTKENGVLTIALSGKLDTVTSKELDVVIKKELDSQVTIVIFDAKELEYISSAGLREIMFVKKTLGKKEAVIVKNINNVVREIFRVTGIEKVITLE